MKKHAFLLGVYKNPDYVEELVRQLDSVQSNIYIHISKLYENDFEDLKRKYVTKDKVAFTERPFPQYKSAFCIKEYEKLGLGQLHEYEHFCGGRKYDQFDYVNWFNLNMK